MHTEAIDPVSDSRSESSSSNVKHNEPNEQQVEVTVVAAKAAKLRENLKTNGWIEVNANNVKEEISRIYAATGEAWVYNNKGVDPEKIAIKGKVDRVIDEMKHVDLFNACAI